MDTTRNKRPGSHQMKRRDFIGAATAATLLGGCNPFPATYKIQYKLTIALKVGGRVYEGSSVNLTKYTMSSCCVGFDGVGAYYGRPWAEAVVIDLGPRGLLFGLVEPPQEMGGFYAKNVADVLLPLLPETDRDWDSVKSGRAFEQALKLKGEYVLPPEKRPVLVRFGDIADRRTAELVTFENVEQIYGKGSAVFGATIALTYEPLTHRIDAALPWLKSVAGSLSPERGPVAWASLSARLTDMSFKLNGDG